MKAKVQAITRAATRAKSFEWFRNLKASRDSVLMALAVIVGIGGGLISVVFYGMIEHATRWATGISRLLSGAQGPASWATAIVAASGGLIVGGMTHYWAREAKGHGVPQVMEAVALRGGRMRPRVVLVKALASTVTIGTGGSAGREGPIVQIGAAIGSTVGQWFRQSTDRMRTLVACGAAAGMAATFNAPLAGAVYALEVILGEFTANTFGMVVLAAAVADVVAGSFLGSHVSFQVPAYQLVSPLELLFYAALGLVSAGAAWLFIKALYWVEDLFDGWKKVPEWTKPAAGGVLFGLVAWWLPKSMGAGYDVINDALYGRLDWALLAALALVKILTTSITLGSGGSGGVFAPSLFIGAMTGGAFGSLVHWLWPGHTAPPGAYALVGMGALFTGTTQAPVTGILMLFELTRDYRIIVPLMVACVVSSIAANWLSKETIDTLKLARRGINLKAGRDLAVLSEIPVTAAMSRHVDTIGVSATVRELVRLMQETRHTGYPVLDGEGRVVGIVTLDDVRNTQPEGRLERRVGEIMSTDLVVAYADESLAEAMAKFDQHGVGRLPVVARQDPRRLVGFLTRSDVLGAYNRALVDERPRPDEEAPGRRSQHGSFHLDTPFSSRI